MKKFLSALFTILFFFIILCFPKTTFKGASLGLSLWFNTILPTLLPFIIITNLFLHTQAIHWITKLFSPIICSFFRVSRYGSFAILTGFLCGYPLGSKITADLMKHHYISSKEGQYLLSFCNNTSPMFIISFLVLQNIKKQSFVIPVLIILFISPILCSFLFRNYYHISMSSSYNHDFSTFRFSTSSESLLDSCIMNGFEAITKIGGYMMLFSILICLFRQLPIPNIWIHFITLPSLEITNGITFIFQSTVPFSWKFTCSLALTSFGGWCAVAQTYSMIHGTGLSIFSYTINKLVTAMVTSLLALFYIILF